MPLSHFSNIQSHLGNWEPVYKNLFETDVILPTVLQQIHPNAPALLLENILSIDFPDYPALEQVEQRFKYSTRLFLTTPSSTSISNLKLKLNINQNDNKQLFTWRVFKDWYDLAWNNEDGSLHYKKNMLGEIIVYQHDREGNVIRRLTYHNCQCSKVGGLDGGDWSSNTDIFSLDVEMKVDWWEDYYY